MMRALAWSAFAAALASSPLPLPPNWDRLLDDEPLEAACAVIVQPLIWQVAEGRREQAANLLSEDIARLLTDAEAAAMLGITLQSGQSAADAAFRTALDESRRRVSGAGAGAEDGRAERRYLAKMTVRLQAGTHRQYRPYLVRSVALAGAAVADQPLLTAQYCDGLLVLTSLFFADKVPQTRRVPTIVFLPSEPLSIDAYMEVSS